jgi:chromosome segregation ATPase
MASDDSEDRAAAKWSDGGFGSSTTLDGAFRSGFRAGREHGRANPAGRFASKAALDAYTELLNRMIEIEATLTILNGNQSAAEGRIRALEEHPERLGSSEKHIDRRVERLENMVRALDDRTIGSLRIGGGAE